MEETGLVIDKPEVPQTFHQLGILVLDGSHSMNDPANQGKSKAQDVQIAMKEMFNRFDASRVKNNFSFACVKFDTTASTSMESTLFTDMDYFNEDFNPLSGKGGATYIHSGLSEAKEIAENFLNSAPSGGVKHSVIILLMSDGMCHEPDKTKTAATELKNIDGVDLACAYFAKVGNNNAESGEIKNLLQEIATNPVQYYTTVFTGDKLRDFFMNSISASVGIAKIG
jgi:Mg-chelatase subunit ChlD|tara:strand:- start:3891 stop:4568 length:678 start_codon:yes stop_codon:yes gene_type:complete